MRDANFLDKCFTLDFKEGIIAAHSKVEVGIAFNPTEVCDLNLSMDCLAKERSIKGIISNASASQKFTKLKSVIKILGRGNYPYLKIVDVRNDSVSVATLWENFSINKINRF